jgi:hypothetical protein
MNTPLISLCASAIHPEFWMYTYNTLMTNKIKWEIIYVGNVKPTFTLTCPML